VEQGSVQGLFSLTGKVAVVTGATGVLGSEMARALARSGARVAVLGRREEQASRVAVEIEEAGGASFALPADVLDTGQLQGARDALLERWDKVDILVNAAGGNIPGATLSDGVGFFELPEKSLRQVMDLNFLGTLLPCRVFGAAMVEGVEEPEDCIVNFSSMAASKTLTNVVDGGLGSRRQFHPLARRRTRAQLRPGAQGQRHSPRLLYRGAEQGPPARRGR
jgi:NAD(P)-dependent dehydrogenase (short-subunit alcohol dehydrogenase family)